MIIHGFTVEVFVDIVIISLPLQKLRGGLREEVKEEAAARTNVKSKMIYLKLYSYVLIFYPKYYYHCDFLTRARCKVRLRYDKCDIYDTTSL